MKQIRRHLTYANVMSSLAVFMVLGGATAFAATKIGANQLKANSVKTGKIVKEAVTAGKIKNAAVTEAKIAGNAVTTAKIADNAVTTPKIANDAVTTAKIANDAVTGAKVNEATLGQVPSAANAVTASTALTPVAYAFVNEDGTVDEALSKGITNANVKLEATSAYCFRDLGFTFKTALATPAYFPGGTNGQDETAQVSKAGTGPDCTGGAQLEVGTIADSEFAPEAFQIWFFE